MEVQIRTLSNNSSLHLISLGILIFNGILHLSFGAAYIAAGNPFSPLPLVSLLASQAGVKAVGAYMIMSGLILMFMPGVLYWNLSKNSNNSTVSSVSWLITVILVLFTFTSAVLTAQIYTPISRYTTVSAFTSTYKNMYNFALADSIITFVLGWPCSLYLVLAANYHRNRAASDEPQKTEQSVREEITQHYDQQMRNSTASPPSRSIDLQKEHYANQAEFDNKEDQMESSLPRYGQSSLPRYGQLSPKKANFSNNDPPGVDNAGEEKPEMSSSRPIEREGVPNRMTVDPKVSTTRFSPSFQVQMPQMPRKSLDLKRQSSKELPQATMPKQFIG